MPTHLMTHLHSVLLRFDEALPSEPPRRRRRARRTRRGAPRCPRGRTRRPSPARTPPIGSSSCATSWPDTHTDGSDCRGAQRSGMLAGNNHLRCDHFFYIHSRRSGTPHHQLFHASLKIFPGSGHPSSEQTAVVFLPHSPSSILVDAVRRVGGARHRGATHATEVTVVARSACEDAGNNHLRCDHAPRIVTCGTQNLSGIWAPSRERSSVLVDAVRE